MSDNRINNGRKIIAKNLKSKIWRMNNLYFITDKDSNKVRFNMNDEQRDFYSRRHNRNLILKARQLGFTTLKCIDQLDSALFMGHKCAMIADRDKTAKSLFRDKVRYAYGYLPESIKNANPLKSETLNELVFTRHGFVSIGTATRGGTINDLHISEFGKICAKFPEKAKEIVTGAFEAVPKTGRITIESTAEGNAGYFHDYCMEAQKLDDNKLSILQWRFFFYDWYRNPDYSLEPTDDMVVSREMEDYFEKLSDELNYEFSLGQKLWYQYKADSLGEDIKREYPSTPKEAFEQSTAGAYYEKQFRKLRKDGKLLSDNDFPDNSHIEVNTYWDLGVSDSTSIWFIRRVGNEFHVIDFYENSGEGMRHYFRVLKEKGYNYGKHYAPHDIENRELSNDAKSRREIASEGFDLYDTGEKYSVEFETVSRKEVLTGIDLVREILPHCVFNTYNCAEGIKYLENYRKEWDEKRGDWKSNPLHDYTSHASDAFRYFAVAESIKDTTGEIFSGRIF